MEGKLIDVREYPEYAAGHIEGSSLVPLGILSQASESWDRTAPLVLVCRTQRRSEQALQLLASKGFTALSVLEGGVQSWSEAGGPLIISEHRPWSIERQVRAVAGSLVLLTMSLAYLLSPLFLIGTALIGAGLLFAGVSDICMMASLLGRLPWNRSPQAPTRSK
jgi:rhodanese-related sulfurtransferase